MKRFPWVKFCIDEVYKEMGAGHSEAVYEACLALEISLFSGEPTTRQVPCPLVYKGYTVGVGYVDILLHDYPIEIKAVSKIAPKDVQQVRKYLEALDLKHGLLINFGNNLEIVEVSRFPDGALTVPFDISAEEITELKERWEEREGAHGETPGTEG